MNGIHHSLRSRSCCRVRTLGTLGGALAVVIAVASGFTAAALALVAMIAFLVAWRRPYLLGPLVAALLPAGERFVVLGVQVSPLEAVIGGGAIGYVVGLATRRGRRGFGAAHWVFVSFCLSIALSTLGPADNSERLRELLLWGALGVVFHAVTTQLDSLRRVRLLFAAIASATAVEAAFALWEYGDRWADRFSRLGGAIVFPLPQGTLEHPNALAQFLVLGTLTVLALSTADSGLSRRVGVLLAAVASIALVVTFSRASWIAFAAGGAVWLLDRRARVPVLVAGAVAILGGAALALLHSGAVGARISSLFEIGNNGLANFRIELIRRGARVVAEHPLTGVGRFQESGVYAGRPDVVTHPHNLFLGVAVFFGIPAALAFAALVALALRSAWRQVRAAAGVSRRLGVGFLGVLVALLVNGLFEYPFWNPALATLIVLVVASVFAHDATATAARRHRSDQPARLH